jgi:glycine hydroxymethyltransferase
MPHRAQTLSQADPELWKAISGENARQETHIELIASENYTSMAVMAAQGSQLTNKYAEGYPGKRYYGGCEFVDVAERLAIDRVKSCSMPSTPTCSRIRAQANQAVFSRCCSPATR